MHVHLSVLHINEGEDDDDGGGSEIETLKQQKMIFVKLEQVQGVMQVSDCISLLHNITS